MSVTRALAALLLLATGGPAAAASLTLSPTDRAEAVRVGQRSVTAEAFDAEWRVVNGSGESVTVLTPFHRVVLAARHAAFQNDPLPSREVDRLLREQRDRLVVWAHLHGRREDFARFYEPRLIVGDREIKAAFVQNERTARQDAGGGFLARCAYGFPTKELAGNARMALVVRNAEGRDVSRFTIDLGKMR